VDPSEEFLTNARARIVDTRATFRAGDAQSLPLSDRCFDAVVSGLALNFVPDPRRAAAEFARVVTPGSVAAAYVWDYAEGMAMMRYFWDAAAALDPAATELDEGRRFPVCRTEPIGGCGRMPAWTRWRSRHSRCRPCSPISTTTGSRSSAAKARHPSTPCPSPKITVRLSDLFGLWRGETTLRLSERTFRCSQCDFVLDRDLKAARNSPNSWTGLWRHVLPEFAARR
jgi:SAM-dependent methyltransferase